MAPASCLMPMSWIMRSAWSAQLSVERTTPRPEQVGQICVDSSWRLGRSRWRDSSIGPNWLILPIWMRARSTFSASRSRFSTWRTCRCSAMSMKSITIRPARSLRRSWRAISLGRLEIGLHRRVVDMALARRAAGIDVDRGQRLGRCDDDRAARRQLHGRAVHLVELVLDPVQVEERHLVGVELHEAGAARHQHLHQPAGTLVGLLALDQHLLDVARVEVAQRALDEVALLVDQARGDALERGVAHLAPQAHEILVVALDLGLVPLGAGRADDQPHAGRHLEVGGDGLEPAAVGRVRDLAADAAAARRVGHQHAVAAGQREIGGERGALVAALLLDDLDEEDLPPLDHLLDLVGAQQPCPAARELVDDVRRLLVRVMGDVGRVAGIVLLRLAVALGLDGGGGLAGRLPPRAPLASPGRPAGSGSSRDGSR